MTKRQAVCLGLLPAFLASAAISVQAAEDDPVHADIKKLADQVGKKSWEELRKESQFLAKKHDLIDVQTAFKRRDSKTGGIGVDGTMIGIEAKIISLSKRSLPVAELAKQEKELIRMAEITSAIASISAHQYPGKQIMGRVAKDWATWSREMHENSQDLIKAVKDSKPVDAKNAAFKLSGTCLECHAQGRIGFP